MAPLIPHLTRRRLSRLALLAIAWSAMSGHAFSGCKSLFSPAVPEPPSGRPIVLDYRSPQNTLRTMEAGIAAKAQGSSAWLGAFPDSLRPEDGPGYHQIFDPADVAYFEGVCQCETPNDWRFSQEQNFYLSLLDVRPNEEYQAEFRAVEAFPDQEAGDTQAVLYRQYIFQAVSADGNLRTVFAVGYASLTFTKVAADKWLITRWEDHVDPAVGVNPLDGYQLTLGRRRLGSTR